jgi:Skp family chaperone for outer membrane proteins
VNAIEPSNVGSIKKADAEEITAMTSEVLEVDRKLNQSNTELDLLNDALKQIAYTKSEYDKKAGEARKRMQRLSTML